MVERVNGTIKNATVKAIMYQNIDEMKQDLNKFLIFYIIKELNGIDSGFILINLKIKHPSSTINGNKQILLLTR
jgi:hypothetical protein